MRARLAAGLALAALGGASACGDAERSTPAAEQPTLAAEQPTLAAEQPTLAAEQPHAEADPCARLLAPARRGFGTPGPRQVVFETLANPEFPGLRVTTALPLEADRPHPVVLVVHANDVTDPDAYRGLLEHIASRGRAAVFPGYMSAAETGAPGLAARYDAVWSGLRAALERHGPRLDPARLGLVGHSFGAGALPALARRAHAAGLGRRGLFLLAMAPWYPLRMDAPADWRALPDHLKALVLSFADDDVTDPRIAIALHDALPVPDAEKDYLLVHGDRRGACVLEAPHTLPQSTGLRARDDALDVRVVHRLLDALAAYAFIGDEAGRRVALGEGREAQVSLGRWRDGEPLRPLEWRARPRPTHPADHYLFPVGDADTWKRWRPEPAREGS